MKESKKSLKVIQSKILCNYRNWLNPKPNGKSMFYIKKGKYDT